MAVLNREQEKQKIVSHGERLKRARIKWGTHLICPDHYIPCKLKGDMTCSNKLNSK